MAKGQDKTLMTLVSVTVLVILAVAFLASISDQTLLNTQKLKVSDESFNLTALSCYADGEVNESSSNCVLTTTYAPTGWKATESDCYLSSVVVTNATGTALTLDTDYTLDSDAGTVTMLNTTDTNATGLGEVALVDYEYCSDNYMPQSWARSVLNTNVGLYVIAILLAVVGIVYLLLGKRDDE